MVRGGGAGNDPIEPQPKPQATRECDVRLRVTCSGSAKKKSEYSIDSESSNEITSEFGAAIPTLDHEDGIGSRPSLHEDPYFDGKYARKRHSHRSSRSTRLGQLAGTAKKSSVWQIISGKASTKPYIRSKSAVKQTGSKSAHLLLSSQTQRMKENPSSSMFSPVMDSHRGHCIETWVL